MVMGELTQEAEVLVIGSGAAFLVVADTAARSLWAPEAVPVGVITALLGGPFFLALLVRRRATRPEVAPA